MHDVPHRRPAGWHEDLEAAAARTLRRNDLGDRTKAAPRLYPHQWSWDSGFIAIGLAHVDVTRAAVELRSLFDAQWANGKVPHIVYNPAAPRGSYFPSGDHWRCAALTPEAPRPPPRTSGLCQPPIHAVAAERVWRAAQRQGAGGRRAREIVRALFPRLVAWHRYLLTERDPERSGLVTIYHPWESGLDNSPRWDAPLAAVEPGVMPPYPRRDLAHVDDPLERPSQQDYERYLWLVESLRRARYDAGRIRRHHPFLVKDVLSSALLVAANDALRRLGAEIGASTATLDRLQVWARRGRGGLDACWDDGLGLALDHDLRADQPLRCRTLAGFAPLIAGGLSPARRRRQVALLESPAFAGNPSLRWPLPPSTSPLDPGFSPRSYWRGPIWPVLSWVCGWALRRAGEGERATRLAGIALAQLDAVGSFPEYTEPLSGEPLGSASQSWTAAVALDWLAAARGQV